MYDSATGKSISSTQKKKEKPVKPTAPTADVVRVKPRTMNHKVHHRTQKSNTLARSPLHKPHRTIRRETEDSHKSAPISAAQEREGRAKSIQRSPSVAKFSHHVSKIEKRYDHLPVAQAPYVDEPKRQVTKSEEAFNKALADADSHNQTHKRVKHKNKRGFVKPLAITASAILLLGFFGYQNLPNLNVRIASSRAGFSAKSPGYTPNGFSTGRINYETGKVVINFKSNSNQNTYSLTEKVSGWNSEALMHNYLIGNNHEHQTQQVKGKTIYLYDGSNATWVNGGVWFNIQSEYLTNDQLIRIASSL